MSKKIKINLTKSSIRDAIKQLQKRKKALTDTIIPLYLERAAEWIQERANDNLKQSDVGEKVKEWIIKSWDIKRISNTHIVLYNKSWKSAYVEFGVGIVGEAKEHPNADNTNWEYNLDTGKKDPLGGWVFGIDDKSKLDIPESAIIEQEYIDDEIVIYTKGTQGVWYLFNALEAFKTERQKSLWIELIKQYWE